MRILLLAHAFNSLTQRLWLELEADGHELSLEYDINDAVTRQAVAMARPDVIIAPFLKRAIPDDIWRALPCLIVHPGPLGDKGPSALDWAVQDTRATWGVTVLQAVAEMDAGPVWGMATFPMRAAPKASIYRREVTDGAVCAVRQALDRIASGLGPLQRRNTGPEGAKPVLKQADRRIDWAAMTSEDILARVRASDGQPGLRDDIDGVPVWLHDAWPCDTARGAPGAILGQKNEAILRATADGAVWIGHLSVTLDGKRRLKLPATRALDLLGLPNPAPTDAMGAPNGVITTRYGDVAVIRFPFLNGALSVTRARALRAAIIEATQSDAKAILLMGGPEFWSNGIDLATIEAAASAAEESLAAINAIDDVCLAMLQATDKWVVAGMQGNAGAGGVFMALAADQVIARDGVVLSPHYKNMGNLFGSEYWTYLLPKRLGQDGADALMQTRMPLLARSAADIGLVDGVRAGTPPAFEAGLIAVVQSQCDCPSFADALAAKAGLRTLDELERPLQSYRDAELDRMRLNFFGFDTSYHVARLNFITAVPKSRTPLHLARHRSRAGTGAQRRA
jgi:putative two-component system hydrogenase maturation factor HypX/HoxX